MQIRTDIPIPPARLRDASGRPRVYPFPDMPIGGSFAVPIADAEKVAVAARMWRKRHLGWNYVGRRCDNEYRIWRTS